MASVHIFLLTVVLYGAKATISVNTTLATTSLNMTSSLDDITPSTSAISPMGVSMTGSCRIIPSTCICDTSPSMNLSVMSSAINMTSASAMVNMTMTSSDISGSPTSYYMPMNSTMSVNSSMMVNQTVNASHVPCTCYGQYTMCGGDLVSRSLVVHSPNSTTMATMSSVAPCLENCKAPPDRNNNNNNNKNVVTTVSSSATVWSITPTTTIPVPSSITMVTTTTSSSVAPCSNDCEVSPSYLLSSVTTTINNNNNNNVNNNVNSNLVTSVLSTAALSSTPSLVSSMTHSSLNVNALAPSSTTMIASSSSSVAPCLTDCADVDCGTAFINACGRCVGGSTGFDANEGMDCNGVCNGTARNDTCNICSNPPENDKTGFDSPRADCHNTCFGTASIDLCGNCTGGETGKAVNFWRDACGICGGDNSSCAGCDGVPNSGLTNDSCMVCGGDGSTCTTISSVTPSLLPTTSDDSREVLVTGAGLDGDSIKCFFDGTESAGVVVDRTSCKCTIPTSGVTAGDKTFTVKVVKSGVDTPTADLTITLYDPAAVKVTGLAPAELFTAIDQEVTFSGDNLPERSDAVCVLGDGTKLKATFDSNEYKCSLPAMATSQQITIALSLNGVHHLSSDVSLNYTVFASAPTIDSAQFSDSGALIHVTFDKNIDTSSLGSSCAAILDSATVSALGTSPSCSWSDGRYLTISPGTGATIVPTNSLTLKESALKCAGEEFSKFATGQKTVDAADNPVLANPIVKGPTQISSCGNLTLDASQSSGGGGRDLTITWSSPDSGLNTVLTAAAGQSKVTIDGSLMTPGTSYTFTLGVVNFLSATPQTASITVTKASDPVPEVTVEGPLGGSVFAKDSFSITAVAKAASCSQEKALTYSWSVVCTNDDGSNTAKTRAQGAAGFQDSSTKAALKIDTGSLIGGKEYTFTVVVALKSDAAIKTTVEMPITAQPSALVPAIKGGDRTLGRDSGSLALDAKSTTVDPDNVPGTLSCSWVCQSNGQPCYSFVNQREQIDFPIDCEVDIPSEKFEAGKTYTITSHVTKGTRSGSSSIVLTVVAGNPPAVSVVTSTIRVVAGDKVELGGTYVTGIRPSKVEWICSQEEGYRFIDLSDISLRSSFSDTYNADGTSLVVEVLKANVLTPGAKYKFILNVNDGSSIGSSNMIVEVRNGPTSGTFGTSTTTLEALDTLTLTAGLWVTDSDAYPLEYTFGCLDDTGVFQSWATQTSNEYSVVVPSGYGDTNQLTVRLYVKDAFGSVRSLDKNITVTPAATIDESKVDSLIDDGLKDALDTGDYSAVIPTLGNILATVAESNSTSANLTAKLTNSTATALIDATKSMSLDETNAEPILQTFLKLQSGAIEGADEVVESLGKVVDAVKENMDVVTVKDTLEWVAGLNVDMNDGEILKDLTAVYDDLATAVCQDLSLGQEAVEVTSDNSDVVIRAEYSLLAGSIPTKGSGAAANVEFGDEMRGKYGFYECASGQYCVGVKLTFVNYKKDYLSDISSTKPGIVADKIISVILQNPKTNDIIPVSGLTDPIKITFDTGTPEPGMTFVGYFHNEDEGKWSTEGLTSTMQGSKLLVSASHLTSFGTANEVAPTTQSSNTSGEVETTLAVADNVFQLSFLLSNTSWNETYLNKSHPQYTELKDLILRELNKVYENDTTLKNIDIDGFMESAGLTQVVVIMTFDGSSDNPEETLKQSLANGKLGDLGVDKDSIKWTNAFNHSTSKGDDDDTPLIIGTVFGVFFGLALLLLGAAWLKNRQSRRKVNTSHPSVAEEEPPLQVDQAETPA